MILSHEAALAALRELTIARSTLDHWEIAQRTTAILDRSYLKPLDIVDYLIDRDLEGVALTRFVGKFAPRVRELYEQQHGIRPLHKLELVVATGDRRPVYAYLETDRDLFDRAWRDLNGEHDRFGDRLEQIVGSSS
jgi:hypothetical protein